MSRIKDSSPVEMVDRGRISSANGFVVYNFDVVRATCEMVKKEKKNGKQENPLLENPRKIKKINEITVDNVYSFRYREKMAE